MKYILAIIFLSFYTQMFAQEKGIIKYEEDITFELPPELKARIKDAPNNMQANKVLVFDGQKMSYTEGEEKEEDAFSRGKRGRRMRFMAGSRQSTKFFDLETGLFMEKTNRFRKDFLIQDSVETIQWKISAGEQRDILGYTCMKGIYQRDSTTIEAWFTPQIPVSMGPDGLHGLPGLILAVGYGENKAILAKEIILDPEDGVELTVLSPSKKALSRNEFDTLMEEQREEMKKMWGGNAKRRKMRGNY